MLNLKVITCSSRLKTISVNLVPLNSSTHPCSFASPTLIEFCRKDNSLMSIESEMFMK